MASAIAAERRLGVARIELRSAEAAKSTGSAELMARRHRSRRGWSRCGRGQASLWCPHGFRRTISRSAVGRNAADQSGTLAPAVEWLWIRLSKIQSRTHHWRPAPRTGKSPDRSRFSRQGIAAMETADAGARPAGDAVDTATMSLKAAGLVRTVVHAMCSRAAGSSARGGALNQTFETRKDEPARPGREPRRGTPWSAGARQDTWTGSRTSGLNMRESTTHRQPGEERCDPPAGRARPHSARTTTLARAAAALPLLVTFLGAIGPAQDQPASVSQLPGAVTNPQRGSFTLYMGREQIRWLRTVWVPSVARNLLGGSILNLRS